MCASSFCQLTNVNIAGNMPGCQGDCGLGEWGEWSECSHSCGQDGVQVINIHYFKF